jgi:ABC-type glycerol-3-phosphate transport system permease component
MGLFLMKQFMESIPMSLIEAAKLDGAGIGRIFLTIILPLVKPAWLTLMIFDIQALWNTDAKMYIYSEEKKMLVYALQQISSGNLIARTGQTAAVMVVTMVIPIAAFILSESQVLETMASSGLKD